MKKHILFNKLCLFTFVLVGTLHSVLPTAAQAEIKFKRKEIYNYTVTPNQKIEILGLDRDATVILMYSEHTPAHRPEQVTINPFVVEKVKEANAAGKMVVMWSNQKDIGDKYSMQDAEETFSHLIEKFAEQGAYINYFDFAEFKNENRKPAVGMARRFEDYLRILYRADVDWAHSTFVGDAGWSKAKPYLNLPAEIRPDGRPGFSHSNVDRVFAEKLGMQFVEAADFFGWRKYGVDQLNYGSDLTAFIEKYTTEENDRLNELLAPKEDTKFDRKTARAKMLKLARDLGYGWSDAEGILVTEFKIETPEGTSEEFKNFAKFFQNNIWPRLVKLKKFENLYETWMVMLDRALYDSEEEKDSWTRAMVAASNKLSEIHSDPQTGVLLKQWSEMVTKPGSTLKGWLADYAVQMASALELEGYPEEAKPLLQKLNQLSADVRNLRNAHPMNKGIGKAEQEISKVKIDYFNGKISFDAAWKKIETLAKGSRDAMAQALALDPKISKILNEMAVLRSKIARTKGFNNWAELILARQAVHYAPGSRTPEERIAFLNGILESTKAPYLEYLKKAASVIQTENGTLTVQTMRPSQIGLLTPTSTLIRQYFPRENFEDIWKKTMKESGIDETLFDHIEFDSFPRDGKQTHAYMANLSSRKPQLVVLNASTLEIDADRKPWFPAEIRIVQNFRDDGPIYLKTDFHEGGHGKDYSNRANPIPTPEEMEGSNSYSETHSMTMEKFLVDESFLVANGRTRLGKALSAELARQYIGNFRAVELVGFRGIAASARYDIELWNYDYSAPGAKPFMTHAYDLSKKANHDEELLEAKNENGVDDGYSHFGTDHFTGGQVRYIGYVYARMASYLNEEFIRDYLKKTTGRDSWYQQPELIPLLKKGYYQSGFEQEFPKPVEAFTGKPFSPEAVVAGIVDAVNKYTPVPLKADVAFVCKTALTPSEPAADKWSIQRPETD